MNQAKRLESTLPNSIYLKRDPTRKDVYIIDQKEGDLTYLLIESSFSSRFPHFDDFSLKYDSKGFPIKIVTLPNRFNPDLSPLNSYSCELIKGPSLNLIPNNNNNKQSLDSYF